MKSSDSDKTYTITNHKYSNKTKCLMCNVILQNSDDICLAGECYSLSGHFSGGHDINGIIHIMHDMYIM